METELDVFTRNHAPGRDQPIHQRARVRGPIRLWIERARPLLDRLFVQGERRRIPERIPHEVCIIGHTRIRDRPGPAGEQRPRVVLHVRHHAMCAHGVTVAERVRLVGDDHPRLDLLEKDGRLGALEARVGDYVEHRLEGPGVERHIAAVNRERRHAEVFPDELVLGDQLVDQPGRHEEHALESARIRLVRRHERADREEVENRFPVTYTDRSEQTRCHPELVERDRLGQVEVKDAITLEPAEVRIGMLLRVPALARRRALARETLGHHTHDRMRARRPDFDLRTTRQREHAAQVGRRLNRRLVLASRHAVLPGLGRDPYLDVNVRQSNHRHTPAALRRRSDCTYLSARPSLGEAEQNTNQPDGCAILRCCPSVV